MTKCKQLKCRNEEEQLNTELPVTKKPKKSANVQSEATHIDTFEIVIVKIESLCIQFWDRDSFIDGPVRSLLSSLEGEFPYRIVELVSLLSALCEGARPSECV